MADRENWRREALKLSLAGVKPGEEPDWGIESKPTHRGQGSKRGNDEVVDLLLEAQAKGVDGLSYLKQRGG